MSEDKLPLFRDEKSYQSIKHLLQEYVGGREEITVSQVTENVESALEEGVIEWEELEEIIKQIDTGVENNAIFPNIPVSEKRERLARAKEAINFGRR